MKDNRIPNFLKPFAGGYLAHLLAQTQYRSAFEEGLGQKKLRVAYVLFLYNPYSMRIIAVLTFNPYFQKIFVGWKKHLYLF